MPLPVLKGAAYALIHAPQMLIHMGTTQSGERYANPDSDYLKKLPQHLREFDACLAYPPNQVFIGNATPFSLNEAAKPWYENPLPGASRFGAFGEIMPEDELLGWLKISDAFDLVMLEESFHTAITAKLQQHPLINDFDLGRLGKSATQAEINHQINEVHAEPLYYQFNLVGCVKRAHEYDQALTAHVMTENLVAKATATIALKNLLAKNNIAPQEIDYLIECSEEACGDMNQRGGGNFAKAIGEMVQAVRATGIDMRGFCAAPVHALVTAAALVQAGVYQNVVVLAGGATAKLGMNGRDHVKKDLPLLEDVIGAFAFLVSADDGLNPIIRTDIVGRHLIGSGSAPQAVMQALVLDPLQSVGLTIPQVQMYSAEMQNPEITVPAGAGDVPLANYKMIAALAAMKGMIDRSEVNSFGEKHGMPGFAPTQGHIPSGVPFLGHARTMMLAKELNNTMIIGKGSLFLGRMTNLFDGVSFVMEHNHGQGAAQEGVSKDEVRVLIAEALRSFAATLLA
ncbi:MAG: glycine/sarcosine/betaine reductase complex component C subunit beta [Symbiobacteriaceae bacterium]|nr:glycine/sarcosine/betaine reductase complex component C subunit beta [Symbiobacteriaceae bacterium]